MKLKLIDSHCHLTPEEYKENFSQILEDTQNKLEAVINVAYDINSSKKVVEISKKYDYMFASIGIHPNYSEDYKEEDESKIIELMNEKKVVAIGECGLDYYRKMSAIKTQQDIFKKQLEWCKIYNKPVIIHGRDAYDDIVSLLLTPDYKDIKGVMHSFTGTYEQIEKILDRFYCSISGIVTFKNAVTLQQTVKKIPIDRLLVETDSPYLTPHPFRQKVNMPSYVTYTANKIAEIKEISYEKIVEMTNKNTKELFNI